MTRREKQACGCIVLGGYCDPCPQHRTRYLRARRWQRAYNRLLHNYVMAHFRYPGDWENVVLLEMARLKACPEFDDVLPSAAEALL